MARLFARASSQGLSKTISLASSPYTMSCWVKPTTVATVQTAMGISIATASAHYDVLGITSSAKPFLESGAATATDSLHATSAVAGVWGHLAGVASSTTNRVVYWNGVASASPDTTASTLATANRFEIGMLARDVNSSFFDGAICEAALWNVALTQAEITMLSLGVSPLLVRPSALVFYVPLMGALSPEPDLLSPTAMTLTGAPTAAPHAPILKPRAVLLTPRRRVTSGSPQTQIVAGRVSSSTFGAVSAIPGGVTKPISGLASEAAFGVVTGAPGGVTRAVAGLASEAAFGTVSVSSGPLAAIVSGLASEAAFGAFTAKGTITKPVPGLASEAAFGAVAVRTAVTIPVAGRSTSSAFGSVSAVAGSAARSVAGLASESIFGGVALRTAVTASPSPLNSASSFGQVSAVGGPALVAVPGLASEAAFGSFSVPGSTPPGGAAWDLAGLAPPHYRLIL